MKIVHICLACFYVENMGYQENILPRYHIRQGRQVTVLTSDYAFNAKGEKIKKTEKEYVKRDGIKSKIKDLIIHKDKFFLMKDNAQKCKEEFFYSKISKRAIGID